MELFKNLKNMFSGKEEIGKPYERVTPFSSSIFENLQYVKNCFHQSADLSIKEFSAGKTRFAVITTEGMVNKENLVLSVMNPILNADYSAARSENLFEYIKDKVLAASEQIEINSFEQLFKFVTSGFAIVAVDKSIKMLAIGVQGFSFRSIAEPQSEVSQRGSREGFTEPMRVNMSLIRRRIKNPDLKFETMTLGSESITDIALCYLTGTVSKKILYELKERLYKVNLDTVLAAGYLVPYLESKNDFSLFSGIGISERPDTVCGKINEGRVAIIVDGTPSVIIVPYLFVESFQSFDDYSNRPYYATFTRWLKYISFFIACFTPGLYVAITTYNSELFPPQIISKIASSVAHTPFTLTVEVLLIHLVYEIMREAGLRLPRPLGHAVSIVGGLVIGETAVNSGLIGSPTLMVVAVTAIASYVIPDLYPPTAFLRFAFIFAGGAAGIWGITILFCAVLVNLCAKNSFGVPYLSPIVPFSLFGMRDVFIRAGWKTLSKRKNCVQNQRGSAASDSGENG